MTRLRPKIILAALAFAVATVPAHGRPALSVDVETGSVIAAHEADRPWHPASVTKLMTAALALEAMRAGLVTATTPVVFSEKASATPPSKLGVPPGNTLPLAEALRIMLTRSMNDVAVAVAETLAGSERRFAEIMNLKAAAIGMRGTRFTNASGLHDPAQVSTASDLALLARHLLVELPESAELLGLPKVTYGGRTFSNTNGLIGHYDGASGMKTGYVCASGFNLVGLAERKGRRVITVVLGAPSAATRERETARLLDDAFSRPAIGPRLASMSPAPGTAPDLRKSSCGRSLGEAFAFAAPTSLPVPAPRPEREWVIAGGLEDY